MSPKKQERLIMWDKVPDLSLDLDQHQRLTGLFWAEAHPPSKFGRNLFSSFCWILLTNRPTHRRVKTDSLMEVTTTPQNKTRATDDTTAVCQCSLQFHLYMSLIITWSWPFVSWLHFILLSVFWPKLALYLFFLYTKTSARKCVSSYNESKLSRYRSTVIPVFP